MSATQPLPTTPPPADHAHLVSIVQGQLEDAARQVKAVALDLVDQHASAGLLRLVDAIRRQAILASLYVADLQNEATRQAYESGAPLPPDMSLSGPMFPTSAFNTSQPVSTGSTTWYPDANASASTIPTGLPNDLHTASIGGDAFLNGS